jgi:glycosyltransferase involved in cell wall biosynthesis
MRVAIIHDWLVEMRGGEKCLESFCELFPDADLFTLVYAPERVSSVIRSMKVHPSAFDRLPGVRRFYRYGLPLFPRFIESFDLRGYDLVLSSSHCVAKGVLPHRALHISYVHAPMRYIWDHYESYFGSGTALPTRSAMRLCRPYLQRWDTAASGRVDCFVANSKNVASKIQKLYGRKAAVIYPPVDLDKFHAGGEQKPFYLIVSALVPYKRIDLAIAAFNALGMPLKIVGEGPLRRRLEKMAGAQVEFLGWVEDEALAQLYASCRALIFPGEEDFGIVPLEAQASGKPVIAYGAGGVLETVIPLNGDSSEAPTGVFFYEQTVEALVETVRLFERQSGRFDAQQLRRHAAKFSRPKFKAAVRAFVEEKWLEYQVLPRLA